tara:strand:- start:651 stop:1136 length:486 start_codon:yes stop_codon:yes gene_type:complete
MTKLVDWVHPREWVVITALLHLGYLGAIVSNPGILEKFSTFRVMDAVLPGPITIWLLVATVFAVGAMKDKWYGKRSLVYLAPQQFIVALALVGSVLAVIQGHLYQSDVVVMREQLFAVPYAGILIGVVHTIAMGRHTQEIAWWNPTLWLSWLSSPPFWSLR